MRVFGDPRRLRDEWRTLEARFLELAGEALRPAVDAYARLTLARHVHISTVLAKRRRFTERLLELAERELLSTEDAELIG